MEGALGHYDTALAGLFEALGARDLGSRTVVMVLSNHGNDLLAHGVLGHNVPFQTVLQVPLIVRDPAATARGATRPERVRTMDVAPTILARAGIPAAASMDGRSFLPLLGLSDEPWAPETAFSLTNRGAVAVLDGDLKLLRWSPFSDRAPRAGPAPEGATATALFDLAADPGETADLAGRRPEEAAALGARLDAWLAEREAEARTGRREPVTPALQQALQERGYWGVVQETPTPGPQGR
jgi:arylsulfatase A-like enzyme